MGPYLLSNAILVGFFGFAAIYHVVVWIAATRKDPLLLVFAVRCALAAVLGAIVIHLSTTLNIASTQHFMGYRVSVLCVGLVAGTWTVSLLCDVRARAYVWPITVGFVAVAAINTFVLQINPPVIDVQRVALSWGETISMARRGPGGWWVAPLYLAGLSVDVFGVYCAFRLIRRDRVGGLLLGVGTLLGLAATMVSAAADVFGQTVIYIGMSPTAFWTLAVGVQIARRNHRSEAELALQEERHRLVLEEIRDYAIYMLDPEGRIVTWNLGATRVKGYEADQIVGQPYSVFFAPDEVAAGEPGRLLELALRDGHVTIQGWRRRRDGSRFWMSGSLTAIRDRAGRLQGFAKVARDRTELKRSESLWRSVVDTTIEGIVTIDERGDIQSVNPAAELIFGNTARGLAGRNVAALLPALESESAAESLAQRARCDGAGAAAAWQTEGRRDGRLFPIEVAVSEWSFDDRRYFTLLLRDVSSRMALEHQLRQAQKMEAIGRLAGGVAHDFNNLLTVINGYADMLLASPPQAAPAHAHAQQIRDAGRRAAALTAQLLALSRQSVMELTVVSLDAVVTEAERMLRRVIGEDVALVVTLGSDAYHLRADRNQLGQVLLNLAVNARDAMPRGGTLSIRTDCRPIDRAFVARHPGAHPGMHVVLKVSDTGDGMTPEVRSHLFEPFFTTKEAGVGTGLGLSVVHGIVMQSGGHIEVESSPGAGATFTIYLPAIEIDEPLAAAPAAERPPRGTETVLVVEDEDAVRDVTRMMLERLGYSVVTATGMSDALRVYADHRARIDMVLTDMVMPQGTGRDLADALRAARPDLPVLFMSGYAPESARLHGGFRDASVLLKPFTADALASKVRRVLDAPLANRP